MLPKRLRLNREESLVMRGDEVRGVWITVRFGREIKKEPRVGVVLRAPQDTAVLRNALRRGILQSIREGYEKLPKSDMVILVKKKVKKEEIKNVRRELEILLRERNS